jgi:hypothetical protein
MHRLTDWYMASVLPGLLASIAIGVGRLSARRAQWVVALLIGASLTGYALYSYAPLGKEYDPELYRVTDHHRLAAQLVAAVPPGASVAAQDPYVPHLSHREHVYLYPWVSIGIENVDYVLLDRQLHPYPLQPHQMSSAIEEAIADPSSAIELEGDGAYLFRQGGAPLPAKAVDAVVDGTMLLQRVEVAERGQDRLYRVTGREPIKVHRGQDLRVSLYWQALDAPGAERTVSVRVVDAAGALAAIHDGLPAAGRKPTSWWQEGWKVRDAHYMTISPEAALGAAHLDVVIYDTVTKAVIPFDDLGPVLEAYRVDIVE